MKFSALLILVGVSSSAAFAPRPSMPFVASSTALKMVSVSEIKELREATGAGMMDCKRALIETDGDMDTAMENLRKKGLMKADKKATRVAAEGTIATASSDDKTVMVEINCETDFVGKDSSFLAFADKVANAALSLDGDSIEALNEVEVDGKTVEELRQNLIAKIGENIKVRRMISVGTADSVTASYIHSGRIGVMVDLEGGSVELGKDIAMHIAAMNPPYVDADSVPGDVVENEKRILTEEALESGKPEAIVEKMVAGRIRKYLEEICLVSQNFVKDSDKTIAQLLKENDASCKTFSRIAVGEGIEKKEDDFAAEVAKMAGTA
eukprot:CAMPEP_0195517770 /NCGR_PEP_ID=MMETSP0794_2-20130614/11631_1 /TAXON_ID=515487 /ORGANISM="Stephanopyxis turris, Strain CCMP 815" /LENGTH=323 /DNA_ID=CAMNT_0040646641 /DNA_START=42 /DNA_END=1013 /DNA_ORIENTATION=-